jgi:murein DD-endopeptidase MepM/ murein hydrolase activator NlpD
MTGRWGRAHTRATLQARAPHAPVLPARMVRTRVVAASIALALLPVSVLAGAVAPPSYAASRDVAPEITWAQVAAAQVAGLKTSVDKSQADAEAKGAIYGKAQAAYDAQQYTVEHLRAQADAEQKKADVAKKTAGQLLAQVSKAGGTGDITASLLGNAGSASNLLSQLSYMGQITDRSKQVYAKALQLQKVAQASTDQADVAKVILAQLKDTAQTAFAAAQSAADAAAAALRSAQATFADLSAKLTKLQGQADVTLASYKTSLVAKWGPGAAGVVSASGWANPANGFLGDRYGMRVNPVSGVWELHTGQDISGAGCGAPIYAAHAGTITYAGWMGDLGYFIQMDNGGGISTDYGHIIGGGILVQNGQHVDPGQQIAKTGMTGGATGCHLHFMVRVNGALTDPLPFMRSHGITLGS